FGAIASVASISSKQDTSGCDPNNQVFYLNQPSQWSTDYFLSVTLGVGDFDFTTAKVIDVLWDLFVSHCGQALAAWLAYKAFSQSLLLSMELVTYNKYTAIAFQETTLRSLWIYIRGTGVRNTWIKASARRPLTTAALTICTLYVLALPTIVNHVRIRQLLRSYTATPAHLHHNQPIRCVKK
ncbi:hypothetical protein LTR81_022308, partial [Elasticomyces elasticus]